MILVAVAISSSPHAAAGTTRTPSEILDFLDDLYRGDSSQGRIDMKIVTPHWTRELALEQWTRGKNLSLIRILAPKKEEGSATLRVDASVWNWLPNVARVVRVSSSMMAGSWMGSHFSNDDLVKQSRFTDDYDGKVTFDGERDGTEVIELTLTPKANAAVVWGRVVALVRNQDSLPIRVTFFDEDIKPARVLTFSTYAQLGGRMLPTVSRMSPADDPDAYTEITYHDFQFSVPLDESYFSLQQLQR
jgi:hypothetical protein